MLRIKKCLRTGLLAIFSAVALAACSVSGVSDYQRAMDMGCRPVPSGGVICSGDRA